MHKLFIPILNRIFYFQYVNDSEGWGYVDLNDDDITDVAVLFEVGYNCGCIGSISG
ncbi:MAG: hypothetical protein IPO24_15550 [Bacteroidetes bacterium]|nr:hypothetical protein [Bacteroidota bacterium]